MYPIKTFLHISVLALALQLFCQNANSQVIPGDNGASATASSACIVVIPIGITKIRDMYFGNIISGNAGTVQISPEGGLPVTTGGVALQTKNSVFSAASFMVNDGLANNPTIRRYFKGYSITLPSQTVTLSNGRGSTMSVGNFTSNSSALGYNGFITGTGYLNIGATLYVNASQSLGQYSSTSPFPVTVNFY